MQILTAYLRPCFFIDDDEAEYEIYDHFPELLGEVREEEVTILLPSLLKQILKVIEDGNKSDSGTLR
ncbi:MAG: hypothetical protein ACLQBQ_02600 [Smithella sp.]